jgi:CRP-like cAMP-binding protein
MTHDRTHSNTFRVTQQMIAHLLGIRRVGITLAAGALQHRGIIEYTRGQLTIVNRQALEEAACSCYASELKTYARLLP